MIYSVTFNPSFDMVFSLNPAFHPGNTYDHIPWLGHAGGKGNNVARAIKQLGGPVTAVGFYGGAVGAMIQRLLSLQQIPCLAASVSESSRVCLTLLTEDVTEIRGQGPEVSRHTSRTLLQRLRSQLKSSDWITLSGSLPPGLTADDVIEWVTTLRPHCQGIVADLSGDNLLAAYEAGVKAICPNLTEFQQLPDNAPSLRLAHILVTEGPDGVLWYPLSHTSRRRIFAPVVPTRNPVGAGDVFVGALVYSLWQRQDWDRALIRAVAAASASVVTDGVGDIDGALLQEIMPQVYIGTP